MQQQQFEPQNTPTWTSKAQRDEKEQSPIVSAPNANVSEAQDAKQDAAQTSATPAETNLPSTLHSLSSPSPVEQLLKEIEQESAKRKRNTRIYGGFFGGLFGLSILSALVTWGRTGHFSWDMLSYVGGFVGMTSVAAGFSKKQKTATREIAQFEDIRAVGPLLEALSANDRKITAVVIPALTRQLPRLQASDASLLNAEQRVILNGLLITKIDTAPVNIPDFYAAALKALQQVGDEKALPTVELLSKGHGMATYYPELKAQAEETLPFLRQRIEQSRASQTLLRASAPAEVAPDTLLRAAMPDTPATDPQELLRAANQQEA